MEKIKALLFVKSDSSFAYLRDWVAYDVPDFACTSAGDKETFVSMIVNGYPDVMRKDNITIPFILLLDDFDENTVKKIATLGGFNFILRSDDALMVRQKLLLTKHLILNARKRMPGIEALVRDEKVDKLTEIPSRQEFMKELRDGTDKALMLLNIDDFGLINDTYGVSVGDKILAKASHAVRRLLSGNSTLYRISGDEFAIFISNPKPDQAIDLVRKIRRTFAKERFSVENLLLSISFTIGVSIGKDSATLQKADIALRRAREIGRNRYEEYKHDPELERKQTANLEWAQKINQAIERDLFFPVFQPIVDNVSRKIVMYECLARLSDGIRVIEPAVFIEPVKRSGLMPRLTRTMIEKSFAAFECNTYGFSINISELDLHDDFLAGYIREKLEKHSIDPKRFIVEISEGMQSLKKQSDIDQILELKNLGVKIAFDDFGKGNSNFSRILDLMPDFIKIDGSFIEHLDRNGRGFKISHAITQFGKSIDSQVIAEFVCSREILERVLKLDVKYSQGYYFGKPINTISGKIDGE
jgi:diguanylate cyclase (GGDEF)-like protein